MKVWDVLNKYYGAWKGVDGAGYVSLKGGPVDDDLGVIFNIEGPMDYEAVAASQTDNVLGNTGGVGDIISEIWLIPATAAPGAVTLKDGGGPAITIYTGGTVGADLKPFQLAIPRNIRSTAGAWSVTTGVNLSLLVGGIFTP